MSAQDNTRDDGAPIDPNALAFTIKETVKLAKISRATIYRMADAGDLQLTKARNRTLISKAELERILARKDAA
jgi:excisionase family DNA binding protein